MTTAPDTATPLFVEKRFPLRLQPHIPAIRELYDVAKTARWDPTRDIAWDKLDVSRYDEVEREAARRTWSRRTWIESAALKETPALIVRFCMEDFRESDPKYFLTVRGTEEAWHVECFHRVVNAFGGFVNQPATTAYADLFNRRLHQRALNAERSLDAYVVTRCIFEGGLELALFKAYRAGCTDDVLGDVLDRCIADKERHLQFGWLYANARAEGWTDEDRQTIAAEIDDHVRTVEMAGYHCPWLSNSATMELMADDICAKAGLGAADANAESAVLVGHVARMREQLKAIGVVVPAFHHTVIGPF